MAQYGYLQNPEPLVAPAEAPVEAKYRVLSTDLVYDDDGDISGFNVGDIMSGQRFVAAKESGIYVVCRRSVDIVAPIHPEWDSPPALYSRWSKEKEAFCCNFGERFGVGVNVVLKLDEPLYGYKNAVFNLDSDQCLISLDESLLSADGLWLTPKKTGESMVRFVYKDFVCERKFLVEEKEDKTFRLSYYNSNPEDVSIYLSNGNPYKEGDILTIEKPVSGETYDMFGEDPNRICVYVNDDDLWYSYNPRTDCFKKEGSDVPYIRISFPLPSFDCELSVWGYGIYAK